jgi:hypothetical protein
MTPVRYRTFLTMTNGDTAFGSVLSGNGRIGTTPCQNSLPRASHSAGHTTPAPAQHSDYVSRLAIPGLPSPDLVPVNRTTLE